MPSKPGSFPLSPELQAQQKQDVRLTQRLIMSAHMQQALKLLQIPLVELEAFLEEQTVANPLLEIVEENKGEEDESVDHQDAPPDQEVVIDDQDFTILRHLDEEYREHFAQTEPAPVKKTQEEEKFRTYLESSISAQTTLYEQLLEQAHQSFDSAEDLQIAEILIGYIDELGFLHTPLQEIASLHSLALERILYILQVIQTFEPYGVGAASIQESLLIQLRCLHKEESLAYKIIERCYDALLHNRLPTIHKELNCSLEEVQKAIERDIVKLDLHPGTQYSSQKAQAIIPDVTLRQEDKQLVVDVNRDYLPALRLNRRYLKLLDDPEASAETKAFIRRHVFSAKWLMRNLQQRYSTLERIVEFLAKKQKRFFMEPTGQLSPLTMKEVADALEVHESTIARTVSNKYVDSPRGLLALRDFFTVGYVSQKGEDLSSKTVKEALLRLIEREDKKRPLSDEALSKALKEQGIACARRTIAKYRSLLNIGNTLQRKKF